MVAKHPVLKDRPVVIELTYHEPPPKPISDAWNRAAKIAVRRGVRLSTRKLGDQSFWNSSAEDDGGVHRRRSAAGEPHVSTDQVEAMTGWTPALLAAPATFVQAVPFDHLSVPGARNVAV